MSQKETDLVQFSLRPQSLGEAIKFAEIIAGSEMVPKDYRGKPANVLVAVQMGMELGLPPLQALQNIAVINGRPSLWGDLLPALVMRHPEMEDYNEDVTDKGTTVTIKRKGRSKAVVQSFTVEDAKAAGLWGKQGPWTQYPKRMMQMRARSFAIRDTFPDALKGLAVAEEVMDISAEKHMGEAQVVEPQTKELPPATIVPSATASKTQATKEKMKAQKLAAVLARIAAAQTEAELQAVADDAAQLTDADKETAKAAYKARAGELRAAAAAPEEKPWAKSEQPAVADPNDLPAFNNE